MIPTTRLVRSPRTHTTRGFSLVELLAVIAMISVLLGLTVPAVRGFTSSSSLNTGVRKMADLLNLARSEAIARHSVVRFAVVTDWPGKPEAALRKASLWNWDPELEQFVQLTNWEELPQGLTFETYLPEYIKGADYASVDGSTVRGDSVLDPEFSGAAEFSIPSPDGTITARFVEFLPSGNARIPGGNARRAIFVTVPAFASGDGELTYTAASDGQPTTWAQVNLDTLTGRIQVLQP
jgi:prepilin-type N-terminal cleavage/methylation domain-containing protein